MLPEFPTPRDGTPFIYHWADGTPAFAVVRTEAKNGHDKKAFRQWSIKDGEWEPKQHIPQGQRPLFGLPEFEAIEGAHILVVEGEKKRIRAAELFPTYFVTCWAGGANAVHQTDWSPLAKHHVTIWPDNDGPGIEAAQAIKTILPHAKIVDVPLSFPDGWDLGDAPPEGVTTKDLHSLLSIYRPEPPILEESPFYEIPPEQPEELPPLRGIVNHLEWPEETPPPRKWIVDGIIPAATVTLLQGDGGLGKSLLTMQLLYACSTGREWLGQKTQSCKTFAIYCEDEETELRRRLWSITQYYRENSLTPEDIPGFSDLSDMILVSRVGMENLLVEFDAAEGGRARFTTLLYQIEKTASKHGAELIVLDSLHDLYGGNENNRVQVRQFINGLQRIAIEHGPAIVINGHPSMSGLASATGTSGSTAWSNSVRSRLYLAREKANEEEKPPYTGPLMLRIMKANYAAVGTHIELRWENGFFVPMNLSPNNLSARDKKFQAERAYLDCWALANKQNRQVQYAHNSQNSAGRMFPGMPTAQGLRKEDFKAAQDRLINDGKIEVVQRLDPVSRNYQNIVMLKKQSDWDGVGDDL